MAFLLLGPSLTQISIPAPAASEISDHEKTVALQCSQKLEILEKFSVMRKPGQKQTTRFSQYEVNSYLAVVLSPKYHPSLKSLVMTFEENRLQGVAAIDFDRLGADSSKLLPRLIGLVFSGIHKITALGRLRSQNGTAGFELEQAYFDNTALPKPLVEEIITAVGRKQDPPFDPLQPSKMPYSIEKVVVHMGYILVYQ
jgi:hypothetical protein